LSCTMCEDDRHVHEQGCCKSIIELFKIVVVVMTAVVVERSETVVRDRKTTRLGGKVTVSEDSVDGSSNRGNGGRCCRTGVDGKTVLSSQSFDRRTVSLDCRLLARLSAKGYAPLAGCTLTDFSVGCFLPSGFLRLKPHPKLMHTGILGCCTLTDFLYFQVKANAHWHL
jgi:hypothetical protein